ncbi:MAG: phosphatidylserine decarboxylase family protein [Planctomycetota bacterium]|nr:phosphatidylserine decarboxylase family protein [Planctomycetota bacterium]MDI6787325.1 phosphatidylserine decarboxylase family protein [Planctomycetota bacterium]
MRLPITRYAINEILIMLLITAVIGYFLYQVASALLIFPVIVFLFTLYFFRDPYRVIPAGDNLIVAPADGRVIEISEVIENTFIKEPSIKIAIFLSLFNVHINRAPCDGKIVMLEYRKGDFWVASKPEASGLNERNSIGLISPIAGKILVRQIAGIIAQRIVCNLNLNEAIKKGMPIGMIKFGSRTEVFIPRNKVENLGIKLNDKVKGGETILGVIKQ